MNRILLVILSLLFINTGAAQGWGQTQKIVASDRASADVFGWAVAIQGDIAIVSARDEEEQASDGGAVYIYFKDNSGNWNQTQKLFSLNQNQFDRFGQSLAIDGNYLIVGARGQDYDENNANFQNAAGAAYIFEKDGSGNWSQIQKIVASDRGETFQPVFGETVAISGNYIVVNKPTEMTGLEGQPNLAGAGACYVFERNTIGSWEEVQKLVSPDRDQGERWGDFSTAISGNTIVVGCSLETLDASGGNELASAGAAYIFERNSNGVWNEVQKLVASDREVGDTFGRSVAIDGDYLVVGADFEDAIANAAGAAYVFKRDSNGNWNEMQKITASNGATSDRFGFSIDIEGNRIIVGCPFRSFMVGSTNVPSGGGAYIFERNDADVWNEVQYNYAMDRAQGDKFGNSVAISNGFALVGAFEEDEDENGENTLNQAGSAYIFDANEPNTLSVTSLNSKSRIQAYPNPVDNMLYINLGLLAETTTVTVQSILGQKINSHDYQNVEVIALPFHLSKGMYLVEIKINHEITSVLKLVKQ
ncbi:T9SS type A sorting domain-containing protein [Psychroserpens algicola]|uniref:T9SS type A sorting domain-containing protein n=1 Tax=Psychroserpens algicola TaxID=1719034 RepID=UPI0019549CD0|nr:T9SS type A sorting domain-containing protein [Psychroserpens algicola]